MSQHRAPRLRRPVSPGDPGNLGRAVHRRQGGRGRDVAPALAQPPLPPERQPHRKSRKMRPVIHMGLAAGERRDAPAALAPATPAAVGGAGGAGDPGAVVARAQRKRRGWEVSRALATPPSSGSDVPASAPSSASSPVGTPAKRKKGSSSPVPELATQPGLAEKPAPAVQRQPVGKRRRSPEGGTGASKRASLRASPTGSGLVGASAGPVPVGPAAPGPATISLASFMELSEPARAEHRARFLIYGDVDGCMEDVSLQVPDKSPKARVTNATCIAVCCGKRVQVAQLSNHLNGKAKSARDSECKRAFFRGFSERAAALVNKSCGGLFTHCIVCRGLHRDLVYVHDCAPIGQVRGMKRVAGRKKLVGAAGAGAVARLREALREPFAPGQISYQDFEGPSCPAAAAAIEMGPFATFPPDDLLLVSNSGRNFAELPADILDRVVGAYNRLGTHVVGDSGGYPDGLTMANQFFFVFAMCSWLRGALQQDAIKAVCAQFPFNYPPSVVDSLRSHIQYKKEMGASAGADQSAAAEEVITDDDLADAVLGADVPAPAPAQPVAAVGQQPQAGPVLDDNRIVDASGVGVDQVAEDRVLRTALRAFREGDLSAANRAAQSATRGLAVARDSEVHTKLRELHPQTRPDAEPLAQRPAKPSFVIVRETVAAVLESVNLRSSGGPSGMTFRLLRMLFLKGNDMAREAILKVLNAIAGGCSIDRGVNPGPNGSESLLSTLSRSARLIALPKSDGSPRPIGIPEALYRVCARGLLLLTGPARVNASLLSGQFGVGSPGGVEPQIHFLRSLVGRFHLVKFDFCNAFNEVDQSVVINEVRRLIPELDHFVTWAYGTPSKLLLRLADLSVDVLPCQRGVRQGCPLSPLLFSLAMRRVVQAIRDSLYERVVAGAGPALPDPGDGEFLQDDQDGGLASSYLDDVCALVRTAEDAALALEAGRVAGAAIGLRLHPTKSVFISKETVRTQAVEILGGHIGNSACISDLLVKKVRDMEPIFERFARWRDLGHTHLVLSLLRSCTVPSRAHIARCEVPSVARAAQALLARRALATLRYALGEAELSPEQEVLATLPVGLAGCGMDGLAAHLPNAGLAYAASVLLSNAVLRDRNIKLQTDLLPEAAETILRGVTNLSLTTGEDISLWPVLSLKSIQARFSERFHLARLEPLVSRLLAHPSAQNSVWLSRIVEGTSKVAGAWMLATPKQRMSPLDGPVVVFGYRRRLLFPTFALCAPRANCGCGAAVARENAFNADSIVGAGPRFGPPVGRELDEEGVEAAAPVLGPEAAEPEVVAGSAVGLAAAGPNVARLAHEAVGEAVACLGLRTDGFHALCCKFAQGLRVERHDLLCRLLIQFWGATGCQVSGEGSTGVGLKRHDFAMPDLQRSYDVSVSALDEVVAFPKLELAAGGQRGVRTSQDQLIMCKWLKDARAVAFSALSRRSQWKRIHHAPQPVIPLVFSAGGGLLDEDDKGALPAPPDRNGRHWVRVALSSVLLKCTRLQDHVPVLVPSVDRA